MCYPKTKQNYKIRLEKLSAMQENWVQFLCWEDPLEKEMATHSRILSRRMPWTEDADELQSMQSQRVRYNWVTNTKIKTISLTIHLWLITGIYGDCLNHQKWHQAQPSLPQSTSPVQIAQEGSSLPESCICLVSYLEPCFGWKVNLSSVYRDQISQTVWIFMDHLGFI